MFAKRLLPVRDQGMSVCEFYKQYRNVQAGLIENDDDAWFVGCVKHAAEMRMLI